MDEKEKELGNSSADNMQEDIGNENIFPDDADEIISDEALTEKVPVETENGEGEETPENVENGEVTAEEADGENEGEQAETPPAPKKSLIKRATEFLDNMGIPDMALVRFIAVFFFISGINLSAIM